jgi:tetratricopeptide (TPR) repeat protein
MDTGIMLTVVFGSVSVAAFIYAFFQDRKAKKAENRLIELEQAMTSYKYLKDKAFDLYFKGQYEESLDVFKKYLLNNKDDKEWDDIIGIIFKKETEKIFSGILVFGDISPKHLALFVHAYILYEDVLVKSSPYPELIKTLIGDFGKVFGRSRVASEFMIALFDKNWQKAKELLPNTPMHSDDDLNSQFRQYITLFLNKKLNISDDGFADDIPF